MPNPETDIEEIDSFLLGKLSSSARADFEKRVATDADFATLFSEQKLVSDGIRLARMSEQVGYFQGLNVLAEDVEMEVEENIIGEAVRVEKNLDVLARFRERGAELDEEESKKEPKTKILSISFIRYAAVAATFLILVTFWWADLNYSNSSIINDLNEPFLNYQQAGTSPKENIIKVAKKDFFSGNYQKAIDNLLLIRKEDGTVFYEAQGLMAYTYFNKADYTNAINQFDLLIGSYYDSLSIEYQDKNRLRWTRFLAYLGDNQKDSSFFQKELDFFLNNKSEIYRKKAQLLQTSLNSNWRKLILN